MNMDSHQSSIYNFTDTNPEDDSVVSNDFSTTLGTIILTLVFLLGVTGNGFVIWTILARVRQRSVTTILILNLACANGFIMVLTLFFVVYLAKQTWDFGNPLCKGLFYLQTANLYASIFLITLMSVHRLVAVVWPRKVPSLASKKIVLRVIIGLWMLVMIISIPSLVFRAVREDKDENNNTRLVCAPDHDLPRHVMFQYSLETVAGFILPYAVIVTSFILILRRLRQTTVTCNARSEKLILAIVVMFGLFWLPYHVINMVQVAAEWYREDSPTRAKLDHIWKSSRAVTTPLALITCCALPILYTVAGKSYIKNHGLAFMARLFEDTSVDQGPQSPQGQHMI